MLAILTIAAICLGVTACIAMAVTSDSLRWKRPREAVAVGAFSAASWLGFFGVLGTIING